MSFNSFPINTENASNNPYPKVILVEGAAPGAAASGQQKIYIDSADHHLKRETSAAVVVDLEAIGQILAADPASPVDGTFWVTDDGGSPAAIKLRFRKGGASYTLAEVTV